MRKFLNLKNIIPFIIFMIIGMTSFAQPANDFCSGAINIVPSIGTYTCNSYDVTGATNTYTPTCAGANREDAWFNFEANDDVQLFELCASSVIDMRLAVYSGTCGSLSQLACWGTGPGNTRTLGGLTAGETYYVSYDFVVAPGTIDIAIHSDLPTPGNNECSGATNIAPAGSVNYSVDNSTRTESTLMLGSTDTWVEFVAAGNSHTVTVTGLDGQIMIGSCGGLGSPLNFIDGMPVSFNGLTIGTTYQLCIGHSATAAGNITVGLDAGVLPLELISFDGYAEEEYNHLFWQSASEINTHYISIERSTDEEEFRERDTVHTAGSSTVLLEYEWKDWEVRPGISYYRLKMVDFDGSFEYSKVISVTRDAKNENTLSIGPNPTADWITIFNESWKGYGQVTFQIFSMNGQLRAEHIVHPLGSHSMDMQYLPADTYIVRSIDHNTRSVSNWKVIKY